MRPVDGVVEEDAAAAEDATAEDDKKWGKLEVLMEAFVELAVKDVFKGPLFKEALIEGVVRRVFTGMLCEDPFGGGRGIG